MGAPNLRSSMKVMLFVHSLNGRGIASVVTSGTPGLRRAIRRYRTDALHAHGNPPARAAVLATRVVSGQQVERFTPQWITENYLGLVENP